MDERARPYAPSVPDDPVGQRAPRRDALRRIAVWLASPRGLALLFAAGFLVRIVLARGGGFPNDMTSFQAWAGRLADRGPWRFYPGPGEKYFVDYAPGYLYILAFLGEIARAFGGGTLPVFIVKLPAILGDLGLAWLVSLLAHRLTPVAVERRLPTRGLAAAAILVNPAFFFISAIWGQVDVFLAIPVVASCLLLGTGVPTFRREAAGMACLALAIGTKPQGAFVLPIVVLLLFWRHARRDAYVAHGAALQGIARVVALGVVGVVTGLLLFAPFHLGPRGALSFYAHSSATYPITSVFAFNFWGVFAFWRNDVAKDAFTVFGVPALYVGLAMFAGGTALVLLRAWRSLRDGEDEGRVLAFGSVALSLVAFDTLTRIHERYLFLPLALLAAFVGIRFMRRAFVVLSGLYLVNVYFPYVYYLRYFHRKAPDLGGLFDGLFGQDFNGPRMKLWSALIAAVTIYVAWNGWSRLKPAEDEMEEPPPEPAVPVVTSLDEAEGDEVVVVVEKPKWTLRLHPVGRRGALLALAVFAVAFVSRVAMLGHPPGMYFDEVYHARTGAEYLGGKEVFEWTHPPLGKEIIGFSIQHLSNFGARGTSKAPPRLEAVASGDTGFVWAERTSRGGVVHRGQLSGDCALEASGRDIRTSLRVTALAALGESTYVGGEGAEGAFLVRYDGQRSKWAATLPSEPLDVAMAGSRAYVLTKDHQLIGISSDGESKTVAIDATAISGDLRDKLVWASFEKSGRVAAWNEAGSRSAVVGVDGGPTALVAIGLADRVMVAARGRLDSVQSDDKKIETTLPVAADALGAAPETGIAWVASGRELHAIEPHAAVVIGRARLDRAPERLLGDPVNHQIVALADGRLECASGRPQFAWRLGSSVFGAAMVAMVFLLALLLFGNTLLASLAALFLAIEGVAFSVSRIAMVDSYSIAFLLAAWFCALSALREWGAAVDEFAARRRGRAIAWLAAGGVFAGLGLAAKWVGLYAILGIGLVMFWDAFARGRDSIWRVANNAGLSALMLAFFYVAVPLAIYVASYIPYFQLGHSFADLMRLQRDMYNYHATLKATHPFGSSWYGWPFGYRAVFLYLLDQGSHRSEIWTFPNIVIFWTALAALPVAIYRAFEKRAAALAILVAAAAVQYLPWVIVSRVTFMYHYLATIPFLCIAVAWFIVAGLRGAKYHREIAIGITVGAVLFFFLTFPLLVGWSMPAGYLEGIRDVFQWVLR